MSERGWDAAPDPLGLAGMIAGGMFMLPVVPAGGEESGSEGDDGGGGPGWALDEELDEEDEGLQEGEGEGNELWGLPTDSSEEE